MSEENVQEQENVDGDVEETVEENLESAIDEATDAVAVQANELADLTEESAIGQPIGLDGVLSVPVKLTVRIGEAQMSLAQLVELGPGSLVPLDRNAHEPADVYVNGKLVAHGEIVTIDEKYAVRISEVKSI
jgi:flagellar motor switch protein FliN